MSASGCSLPFSPPGVSRRNAVAEFRQLAAEVATVGARQTHLARVDLLTAERIVVGTHVGGFGVIPVVLVVGLSSVVSFNIEIARFRAVGERAVYSQCGMAPWPLATVADTCPCLFSLLLSCGENAI
jgi:hypothetical protein